MSGAQRFAGRTAIVTGAATGIGGGAAAALAAEGAAVVLADIDAAALDTAGTRLADAGHRVLAVPTDVTDTAANAALVEAARASFGSVDVLVVAAGGHGGSTPAEDVADEDWERSLALNLTAAFKSARAVIPVMKAQRSGRIVMVSSASGRMPSPTTPSVCHYVVAKTGMLGLVRQLAVELGPYGVTVNAVAPGTTRTPRVERFRSEESLAEIARGVPLGRVATVEDQVGPILFLASPEAGYCNGATLDVNGGRLML